MANGNWFFVQGFVPERAIFNVTATMKQMGVREVQVVPVLEGAHLGGKAVDLPMGERRPKNRRGTNSGIHGQRPAGTGKKGVLRAHVDALVRDGTREFSSRDLRNSGADKQTISNLMSKLAREGLVQRTSRGEYMATDAYPKHLASTPASADEQLGETNRQGRTPKGMMSGRSRVLTHVARLIGEGHSRITSAELQEYAKENHLSKQAVNHVCWELVKAKKLRRKRLGVYEVAASFKNTLLNGADHAAAE